MPKNTQLTPKAQQTRQRIFDVAIEQFAIQGYEQTTMRDIAKGAECSLGLAYRYFDSKEALVLELWRHLAVDFAAQLNDVNSEGWVDRFYDAMQIKIRQLEPYRDVVQATLGAAMNPGSGVAIIGDETTDYRDQMLEAFEPLIVNAKDAPKALRTQQLTMLMYGIHLQLILVWVYDRSPNQQLTQKTLSFMLDIMKLLRPMLILPPVANNLKRLADIMEGIFAPKT
jgi:AcrR family transcriptional regulator